MGWGFYYIFSPCWCATACLKDVVSVCNFLKWTLAGFRFTSPGFCYPDNACGVQIRFICGFYNLWLQNESWIHMREVIIGRKFRWTSWDLTARNISLFLMKLLLVVYLQSSLQDKWGWHIKYHLNTVSLKKHKTVVTVDSYASGGLAYDTSYTSY